MRRFLRTSCLAAATALATLTAAAATLNVKADSRVEVVYITAKDCVYCRSWRYTMAGDWGRFSESATGKHVELVTVDKGTLRNAMKREYYAPEHAKLFDRAPAFGNMVPAWWVLLDGVPVTRRAGENTWRPDLEPVLEMIVKAKLAGGANVEFVRPVPYAGPVPAFIEDENVPYLSARARESYRGFLKSEKPRAFALSADGAYGWRSGGKEPGKQALASCNSRTIDFPCKLYAVDDEVVYKGE